MPKKSAPKKTRVATKKTANKALSLNQSFLDKEQAAFHKDHPQAEKLISIFLIAFLVLVVIFLYQR